MLTRQTVESFDDETQEAIKAALTTLAWSRVFDKQIESLEEGLLDGSLSEDPLELGQRIIQFRVQRAALQEINQLGHEYNKEQTR